jgi:hypothetical protein
MPATPRWQQPNQHKGALFKGTPSETRLPVLSGVMCALRPDMGPNIDGELPSGV